MSHSVQINILVQPEVLMWHVWGDRYPYLHAARHDGFDPALAAVCGAQVVGVLYLYCLNPYLHAARDDWVDPLLAAVRGAQVVTHAMCIAVVHVDKLRARARVPAQRNMRVSRACFVRCNLTLTLILGAI